MRRFEHTGKVMLSAMHADHTTRHEAKEVYYTVPAIPGSGLPGNHAGRRRGNGFEFREHVPIGQGVDPRRFDVRASMRDPLGRILVRAFEEPTTIPVLVLGDMSASMGFIAQTRKLDVLADFVAALGVSAYRNGDPFGFCGFHAEVNSDFFTPASRTGLAGERLAQRLRDYVPEHAGSQGVIAATRLLVGKRSLVFLVSDFYFDSTTLSHALAALAGHVVVPVVLTDSGEYERLPRFGLARITDPETGAEQTVLFRPAFNAMLRARVDAHRTHLRQTFSRHGLRGLWLRDGFRADDVTRFFLGE